VTEKVKVSESERRHRNTKGGYSIPTADDLNLDLVSMGNPSTISLRQIAGLVRIYLGNLEVVQFSVLRFHRFALYARLVVLPVAGISTNRFRFCCLLPLDKLLEVLID
jgi:hypothetical protein